MSDPTPLCPSCGAVIFADDVRRWCSNVVGCGFRTTTVVRRAFLPKLVRVNDERAYLERVGELLIAEREAGFDFETEESVEDCEIDVGGDP